MYYRYSLLTNTNIIISHVYHHPLLRCVGCAHLFPSPTVTRLCSAYVEMSILNGSEGASGGAVFSGGGGGGGATVVSLAAWVWLCAGTDVVALAGSAAALDVSREVDETSLVITDELSTGAGVVLATTLSLSDEVAESILMLVLLDEDDAATSSALALATTVTAEVCVCSVVAAGPMEPIWYTGGGGAMYIGKEPAGHLQWHLQAPFEPACSADTDPEPATTVAAAAADVDVPMRPGAARDAVSAELEDDEAATCSAGIAFVLEPAMTVTWAPAIDVVDAPTRPASPRVAVLDQAA
jgi:hypothetical protein